MIVRSLFRLLASTAAYYFVAQLGKQTGKNQFSGKRIRSVLMGGGLVVGSAGLAFVAVVLLIGALFFQLADMTSLVIPALITAGVSVVLAVVIFLEGLRLFRRHQASR